MRKQIHALGDLSLRMQNGLLWSLHNGELKFVQVHVRNPVTHSMLQEVRGGLPRESDPVNASGVVRE